jgi:GTP cyclohydrolase III
MNYRSKAQSKFENRELMRNRRKRRTMSMLGRPEPKNKSFKKVLVIGDSMVKHIDRVKIERAAGCQSVVHSYSGSRVEQISSKVKEYWSEVEQYDTVLLHVGTNNLASEEPEEVASKMNGLIKDLKDHAKKIAISSN